MSLELIINQNKVASLILSNNNLNNFSITYSETISRCNFKKEHIELVFAEEKDGKGINKKIEEIVVGAHEATHALNYQEGVTNTKVLNLLENISKVLLFGSLIPGFISILDIMGLYKYHLPWFVTMLLLGLFTFIRTVFIVYYLRDEYLTENRSLSEIKANIEIDKEEYDAVCNRVTARKRYLINVFFVHSFLLIVPIGCSLPFYAFYY